MAADVSARVHLVAEKLQQKAQDAQRKGNDGAARALSSSVADLRQAMALISEQRHLLARRRAEGVDEEDDADAHVQQLAQRLERVEAMLGKKSEDMKAKGNENAAGALQQSAKTVEQGRTLLLEQQQRVFGLLGRWEKLEDVVGDSERRRGSVTTSDSEADDKEMETPHGQVIARVRQLKQLEVTLKECFPQCQETEDFREELQKVRRESEQSKSECERLQQELEGVMEKLEQSRQEAVEVSQMLEQESAALEEAKNELERQRERELQRQEEDSALLQQQTEACKAMEELVREGDKEIQRMTENEATRAEEMQSLRVEVDSLATEREHLVRTHTDEIEELQRQLESAMDALSAKADESAVSSAEELQSLQIELEELKSEKEHLVESHSNVIDELKKTHADELEELRCQLENATTALSANTEIVASDSEDQQSLQTEIEKLALEKEHLVQSQIEEVEQLRRDRTVRIEEIQRQLEDAKTSLVTKTEECSASTAKVDSLQAEVDRLVSEKEQYTKSHVENISADNIELQQLRAEVDALVTVKEQLINKYEGEIKQLRDQLESTTTAVSKEIKETSIEHCEEDAEMDIHVDVAENDIASDVPVLELEGIGLQPTDIAVEEQIETAINEDNADIKDASKLEATLTDLQQILADYEEQFQAQQNKISALERDQIELQQQIEHLTKAKAQDVEKLNRAQEEIANVREQLSSSEQKQTELQQQIEQLATTKTKALEDLHTAKEESASLMQQLSTLERERSELQQQNELLTKDKKQAIDEKQSSHDEEVSRISERITASDNAIETVSAQLAEVQEALKAKSKENHDITSALERCEAELSSCRSELENRTNECSGLQDDLQAAQDATDAERGEVDKRLSLLIDELREVIVGVHSDGQLDAAAVRDFTEKTWQSPETTELCSCLAPLLNDLILVQEQLLSTQHQLDVVRGENDEHNLAIQHFLETTDVRLLSTDVEDDSECVSKAESEDLADAKTNSSRWLPGLEGLRENAEKSFAKIKSLEQENEQKEQHIITLETSLCELQSLVDSLREQLESLQSEKDEIAIIAEKLQAQKQSASVQEQEQQAAQQEEVADLQQQLAAMRNEFERYRLRSHTALKKMEKRAELLNGMRKENDELLKQVTESKQEREQAEAARKSSEVRLEEVQQSQEKMQADFDEYVAEKARAIAELEEETQRLESERAQADSQIQELKLKIEELEMEKTQLEKECQRVKEAEQAAFEARLNTAASAVRTAKQDLMKVQDALTASKAENEKRQQRIDSLEATMKHLEAKAAGSTSTNGNSPATAYATKAPAVPVHALASPSDEAKRSMDALHNELAILKTSESSLRTQLDDARAELIALQERFATTKAANAEKEFALEEQINHLKMQLATTSKEVHQLNAVIETRNSTATQQLQAIEQMPETSTVLDAAHTTGVIEKQLQENLEASKAQIQRLSQELCELKIELADTATEATLQARALDACREELQEARDQIDLLTPSSSEPENGVAKSAKVLAAKEEALKKLRFQVLELQEELHKLRKENAKYEQEREQKELNELQTSRQKMQSEKELALRLQRREALVAGFEKQVSSIVKELQQRLEDHSTAFREVCDFRDEHRASLFAKDNGADSVESTTRKGEAEYDECLVMRSGVVIKAGSSFQLPVICEKRGWRVVWNFSVKEEAADVAFKLAAVPEPNATEVEIVPSERMNEMSGVFQVQHDNTTLVFEWDNSFSWLNEKTLDYHVSIQEPLTPQAQKVRHSKRELQSKAKLVEEGLALIQSEVERRSELSATLERLHECESAKDTHLAEFEARKEEVLTQKTNFQEEMEAQKTILSTMLQEQDELEDVELSITRAWATAVAERQDVEMTLQLAGSLETLTQELEEHAKIVAEELARPTPETVDSSKSDESETKGPGNVNGVTDNRKVEVDSSVPEEKHE
ncbi:hypothetical protein PHYBOEH_008152 [Phytophthora boehmeriae]|uniref:GOLD domain-containing protein n=1 Tax=Phytophthora boehmeriae TaxID=109152 RepID=A0A8T1W7P6_9STRA|nr:hypothetical protein PHYBOEH_008152 [Phytophthora boehmeriae]